MAVLGCLALLLCDEAACVDFGDAHGVVAVVDAIAGVRGARLEIVDFIDCRSCMHNSVFCFISVPITMRASGGAGGRYIVTSGVVCLRHASVCDTGARDVAERAFPFLAAAGARRDLDEEVNEARP